MNKIPITVVVSVKNEELNLPHCLEKLSSFSEIIVVDSQSTDNTPKIVEQFGYQLINFTWNGKYPKKRNWTLQNIPLKNDWILFLDADEFLTNQFIEEVGHKIKNTSASGFWIYYNNYFMGKEQKYGLKMRKLALFKKDKGVYEKIEEDLWSHLDMEIHEHPIIEGPVSTIKSTIQHKDYKGLEHYIARHNAYSSWEANRFLALKKEGIKHLTLRQKLKYNLITSGLLPSLYFFGTYILKLGFLDGVTGFHFARYKAHYFFQIQTKITELKTKI
ncbi:glycosyltransferase family 2 protein [Pseudotamlana carrageenivorans]|uniref:Glycosyltransferase family 2 protein n=1 Tax=Pseudotamlana carrageenivorans TaxID=2069432 RepID=A0A2I7SIU7_9FLAO|nr:glycosyltransferase family 2 protein [Tamlana carrageenivorans]AUS05830.1 glycosyltransferase family 2 protein [Tamlana carrageenivorans]